MDCLSSVVAMLDTSGEVLEQYRYSPYGVPGWEGSAGFPFRFTGQKLDPETGLYYYKARYYDPETGRFLQADPIGYEDQMNLYAYVGNDPVNMVDPSGLIQRDICRGNDCITVEAGDLSQEDTEDFLSSVDDAFFKDNAGRNFSEEGKAVIAENGASESDADRVAIATQLVGGKINDSGDMSLQKAWKEVSSVIADGGLPGNLNGLAETRINNSSYGEIRIRAGRTNGRNGGSNTLQTFTHEVLHFHKDYVGMQYLHRDPTIYDEYDSAHTELRLEAQRLMNQWSIW